MSTSKHTYTLREVGFGAEVALSPHGAPHSMEFDEKSGSLTAQWTSNPLASLRAAAEWVTLALPASPGVVAIPAEAAKVAIAAPSVPIIGEPVVIVAQGARTLRFLNNNDPNWPTPPTVLELGAATPTWYDLGFRVGDIIRVDNVSAMTLSHALIGDYEITSLLVQPGNFGFPGTETWARVRRVDGTMPRTDSDAGQADLSLITRYESDVFPKVTFPQLGHEGAEGARYYGVDQLTLPPGPPTSSLIHWFDFADEQTVFQDVAGTQPAQDGDPIRHIANKGSDGTPLLSDSDAESPTFHLGVVNGQSVARFNDASERLYNTIANGLDGTVNGTTLVGIVRTIATDAAAVPSFNWGGIAATGLAIEIDGTIGLLNRLHLGSSSIVPVPAAVVDDWYLIYVALNTGFSWDYYGSPGPESSGFNGANPVIAPSTVMEFISSTLDVEWAEAMVYAESLVAAPRSNIVSYANSKYGMLPHS